MIAPHKLPPLHFRPLGYGFVVCRNRRLRRLLKNLFIEPPAVTPPQRQKPFDAAALVKMIRVNRGRVTPKKLWQSSRKYRPTSEAEKALEKLIAAGYGCWEITSKSGIGRPKIQFILYPERLRKRQNSRKTEKIESN